MLESGTKVLFYKEEDFKNLIVEVLEVAIYDYQTEMKKPQDTEQWLKAWLRHEMNSMMDQEKVDGILIEDKFFTEGREIVDWLWKDKGFAEKLIQEIETAGVEPAL